MLYSISQNTDDELQGRKVKVLACEQQRITPYLY